MAEVTAMRNNATDYPIYGLPWTITFPMLDADGDLVTGASTPDAEISKNGDTFADCTNESTEIASSSGIYYLTMTATEMTADIVSIIAKSATSGMKTTPLILYPKKLPLLLTADNAGAYDSTTTINLGSGASAIDDFYNGCLVYIYGGTGNGQVRMITDYVGSTKLATVHVAWATNPDATSDLKIYRTELAPYVMGANVNSINGTSQTGRDIGASVLLSPGTGTGQISLTSGAVTLAADQAVNVTKWKGATAPDMTGDAYARIGANGAGLTAVPWNAAWDAEVQSECADALVAYDPPTNAEMEARTIVAANYATASSQATIAGYLDTEIAAILADTNELQTDLANGGRLDLLIDAIKAKTDNLPTDPADQSAVEAAITAATSPLATAAALDAVDNYIDTEVAAIKAVADKIDTALELDGAVYRLTANALELAPTGGGSSLTVQDIVNGVLDEALSGHATAGTAGAALAASGAAADPLASQVPGTYAAGTAGAVLGSYLPSPGTGAVTYNYLLTEPDGITPIRGADVRVSTDAAGETIIAYAVTNYSGIASFLLDPGTYYFWRQKTGYTFTDPDTEVVS